MPSTSTGSDDARWHERRLVTARVNYRYLTRELASLPIVGLGAPWYVHEYGINVADEPIYVDPNGEAFLIDGTPPWQRRPFLYLSHHHRAALEYRALSLHGFLRELASDLLEDVSGRFGSWGIGEMDAGIWFIEQGHPAVMLPMACPDTFDYAGAGCLWDPELGRDIPLEPQGSRAIARR